MNLLFAIGIGTLAGLHASTWGMYKDSPYEGFRWSKYARSAVIGAVAGAVVYRPAGLDPGSPGGAAVLWGLSYAIERAFVEWRKTFFREEDQSKYAIPMQFAVRGAVVRSTAIRRAVGLAYLLGVVCAVTAVDWLGGPSLPWPWTLKVVVLGSVGGWISAFGGAWKDAPVEGFHLLKFFRSPLVATTYALILSQLTAELAVVTFSALGYTIASLETLKTFFSGRRASGKFAGKPIGHPEMLERRRPFAVVFLCIWLLVAALVLSACLP